MTGVTAQSLCLQLVHAHDRGQRCPPKTQDTISKVRKTLKAASKNKMKKERV